MIRHIFSSALLLIALSTAVFAQVRTIQVAGVLRKYIVYAPSGLDNPPVVFNIHGYNMDAASEQNYTKMDQIADRDKFIVVYPEAIDKAWDLSGENDFAFILAIIDTIDATYHIDRTRIYSAGFSMGGFMSFLLACRHADIFAAIAPTSGLITGECNPSRPVPMRLTFGTDEGFEGGTASFMQSVEKWLEIDSCPDEPEVTEPYPASNPHSLVTRLYYGPCAQGTEVIADSIRTGQHEWPMNTSDRINNSEETWAFLKRFSLESTTQVRHQKAGVKHDACSLLHGNGCIRIQGVKENTRVRVFDNMGRYISSAVIERQQIDFKNKSSGIYIVNMVNINESIAFRVMVP